jgi:type I restriction enzyme S subunit
MSSAWNKSKLDDIATVIDSLHKTPKYSDTGYPMVRVTDIKSKTLDLSNTKKVDKDTFLEFSKRHIPKVGDIVFSRVGSYGKSSIVETNNEFCLGQNTVFLIPNINPYFFYYFLNSPLAAEQIDQLVSGTTQPTVSLKSIKSLIVPVPTAETQKKIVAKLDQAFADIEKAKVNAEQNSKNAKELFESYLQEIFSHSQEGWAESKLQNITSKIGSGATPRGGKAAYKEHGMSLIRSMNVHDRRFKEKNLALIDDEQAGKLNNVTLEKDDVLLNITGASVARCCVVPDEYLPARVNQHVSIIRVEKDIISPRFICFLLTSTFYKNILLEVGGSGATREAITKVQLQNFVITYPDTVEKQEEFLDELTGIESQSIELQNIYTKKIHALDELKQSILQKAFNGELA